MRGDPLLILGLDAKVLVVQGTEDATADDAGEQGRRSDHGEEEADARTLADAATSELVGLDLPVVIESQDAQRIELDVVLPLVPFLHLRGRVVCLGFALKERQHHRVACHIWDPFPLRWPTCATMASGQCTLLAVGETSRRAGTAHAPTIAGGVDQLSGESSASAPAWTDGLDPRPCDFSTRTAFASDPGPIVRPMLPTSKATAETR